MSAEAAVVGRLVTDNAVSALVGSRVYLAKLPATLKTWPAIVVQVIDDPQRKHLRGPHAITEARVQVDCYSSELVGGNPHTAVAAVAAAVNDSLVFEPFTVGSMRVSSAERVDRRTVTEPADERRLVRMLQDFKVWSKPV